MHRAILLVVPLLVACPGPYPFVPDGGLLEDGGQTATNPSDAGLDAGSEMDAGTSTDAGTDLDAGFIEQTETEPNGGGTATELNDLLVPASLTGAIGTANDIDIFKVDLTAGQLWRYRLAPGDATSDFAPHFAMSEHEHEKDPPNLVALAASRATAEQEHFVLSTGRYNVFVRDARNVPSGSSQNVGGASVTWQLTAERLGRAYTDVAVPSTTADALASARTIGLYRFTTTSTSNVRLRVLAQTKSTPSNMDAQLSLYSPTTGYVGTNDDANASKDSQLDVSSLPAGTYVVVVENLRQDATDLSYELVLSTF